MLRSEGHIREFRRSLLKLLHIQDLVRFCKQGAAIEKSQAPDDGCINVRNMLNIEEVK